MELCEVMINDQIADLTVFLPYVFWRMTIGITINTIGTLQSWLTATLRAGGQIHCSHITALQINHPRISGLSLSLITNLYKHNVPWHHAAYVSLAYFTVIQCSSPLSTPLLSCKLVSSGGTNEGQNRNAADILKLVIVPNSETSRQGSADFLWRVEDWTTSRACRRTRTSALKLHTNLNWQLTTSDWVCIGES